MRKPKLRFYVRGIIKSVAGVIYEMAPLNRPREMNKIMDYVQAAVYSKAEKNSFSRYIFMMPVDFEKWLKEMLLGCHEFVRLNLTQNEVDADISVDNPDRPAYTFTSRYDTITDVSWREDFIDLDACIRNIILEIYRNQVEKDCFLCDNEGTELCSKCSINPKYSNCYFHANAPCEPNIFDGWCSMSCSNSKAVCCKDCSEKNNCNAEDKCSECPSDCENYIKNPDKQ